MEREAVDRWVNTYEKAWASDDPDDIAALFTEDAVYSTGPFDEEWRGPDDIVKRWIAQGDSAYQWTFRYEVVAIDGDVAVIEGWTDYTSPDYRHSYNNMWLIELAGDRAKRFKEWWIEDPATRT